MKGLVVLLISALLIASFPISRGEEKLRIGLVFDVGGRGDKSFNDAAYRGLEWASQKLGVNVTTVEPGPGGADREILLRRMARSNMDLVIGVGFLFSEAIVNTAKDYPGIKFACVDMDTSGVGELQDNIVALVFNEEEGSFVVGAIAAMKTERDTVGFVGGMTGPLIERFEAGYISGVKYINPQCKVISVYAGNTPQAFADPGKGYELGLQLNRQGADVIYHASGNTGTGVYKAAQERGFYVIGVDSNQNYLGYDEASGKNWGLTSMLKRVDVATYLLIEDLTKGKFEFGVHAYGLKDFVTMDNETYRTLDFAVDEYNRNLLDEKTIAKANQIVGEIVKGEIKVPREI